MALTDVNLFRIDGTVGSVSNVQTAALNGGPLAGSRNRIINGDMRIDQRNDGASVTPSDGQYVLDRWKQLQSAASKYSVQQNAGSVALPAGFTNYLGCTSLSAYSVGSSDYFTIQQDIEGFNISDLDWGVSTAKSVTLSFWVYSSLTGTFGGTVKNSANTRSYPFSYTISSANTWEYKTITVPGDTSGTYAKDNTAGIRVVFGLGVGTSLSAAAGSWAAGNYASATGATSVVGTNGATFYITGVQLEPGTVATPFERRSYGQELALCQRYCFVISGQTPGGYTRQNMIARSTVASQYNFYTPVPMRAVPSFSAVNCNNSTIEVFQYRIPLSLSFTNFSMAESTNQNMYMVVDHGSGVAINDLVTWRFKADPAAFLIYSAEL